MVYAQRAAVLLKFKNGKTTPEALEAALKRGRAQKRLLSRLAPLNDSGAKVLATAAVGPGLQWLKHDA